MKFNVNDFDPRIVELARRADKYDHLALDAMVASLDGKVHPAKLGPNEDIAGTPRYRPAKVKSPRDQGLPGGHAGKKFDLSTPEGCYAAWKAGEIDLVQYRKRLKALQDAAEAKAENGPQNVGAESAEDDSLYSDLLDSDSDDEADDEEDEDAEELEEADELKTAPKTVRRKTARVHATLSHIETAADTSALELVGKFTWDEIEKGMREAQEDLEINPDLPSSRRARLRRLVAEGVPPVQAMALVKINSRELAS
jgi:hypothetical protein